MVRCILRTPEPPVRLDIEALFPGLLGTAPPDVEAFPMRDSEVSWSLPMSGAEERL